MITLYRIHKPENFEKGITSLSSQTGISFEHKSAEEYSDFISGRHFCGLTFNQLRHPTVVRDHVAVANLITYGLAQVSKLTIKNAIIVDDQSFFELSDVVEKITLTRLEFIQTYKKSCRSLGQTYLG